MVDKLKFNNLVISGSKEIQKARIQIIRKIIQRMRQLQKLIDKRPNDDGLKIKLRKLTAVIEALKKIKRMGAVMSVLLLEKTPIQIVSNSNSTPDETAIAMLASNKVMKSLVTRISQTLGLEDSDASTWRKSLKEIVHLKQKKLRRKKIAQQKRENTTEESAPKKSNKKKTKKTNENSANILSSTKLKTENVPLETKTDEEIEVNVKEIETIPCEPVVTSKKNKVQNKLKAEANRSEYKNNSLNAERTDSHIEEKVEKIQKTKSKDNVEVETNIKNKTNAMPINKFRDTNESNLNAQNNIFGNAFSKNYEFSPKPIIRQPVLKPVVDPFFITSTGENYVTLATDEPERTPDVTQFNENRPFKKDKPKFEKEKPVDLHPSWAAKKNQRPIAAFQGKRTTFDDSNKSIKPTQDTETTNIHPSWAAKQKLKPVITAFQGKKIKFDD